MHCGTAAIEARVEIRAEALPEVRIRMLPGALPVVCVEEYAHYARAMAVLMKYLRVYGDGDSHALDMGGVSHQKANVEGRCVRLLSPGIRAIV